MNKNNKGFLLSEALVVSTILLTGLVFIYSMYVNSTMQVAMNRNMNTVNATYLASQIIRFANDYEYWLERAQLQRFSGPYSLQARHDVSRAIELLEAGGAEKDALQRAYMQRAGLTPPGFIALKDCLKVIEMASPDANIEVIRCQTFFAQEGISIFDLTVNSMQALLSEPPVVLSVCEQLLKRGCDERRLLAVRGQAYWQMGEQAKAIEDYKVVVMFEPSAGDTVSRSDAYASLGVYYRVTGKLDEAFENFSLALEEDPKNAYAYYGRGFAYQDKSRQPGLTEEQRKEFQELAKQDHDTRMELLQLQQQRRPPR